MSDVARWEMPERLEPYVAFIEASMVSSTCDNLDLIIRTRIKLLESLHTAGCLVLPGAGMEVEVENGGRTFVYMTHTREPGMYENKLTVPHPGKYNIFAVPVEEKT